MPPPTTHHCVALLSAIFAIAEAQPSQEALKRVEAATASERAAVALNPHSADAYRNLASAYTKQKFLRAASEALGHAVALTPSDAGGHIELGMLLRRVGDPDGARRHFEASLALNPASVVSHMHLSFIGATAAEKLRSVRAAIALEPRNGEFYSRLARVLKEEKREAEVESTYRALAEIDPAVGGQRLYEQLRFADRKLEAAVELLKIRRAQEKAATADGDAPAAAAAAAAAASSSAPSNAGLDEWSRYVDGVESAAEGTHEAKCLTRECIEGLEAALVDAEAGARAAELPSPQSVAGVLQMLRDAKPTVLKAAAAGWGPTRRWDAAHLRSAAGQEELEVTIVTEAGSFEVRHDRIERPPKSVMRLGDFVRLLSTRRDANLTIYSRQAPLWPMGGLLSDLDPPMPWMEGLRLNDLNFWLGDGHFRNTLHFDPYDNFLCQVRCRLRRRIYIIHMRASLLRLQLRGCFFTRPDHLALPTHFFFSSARCAARSTSCSTHPRLRQISTMATGATSKPSSRRRAASLAVSTRGSSLPTPPRSTAQTRTWLATRALPRRGACRATRTCSPRIASTCPTCGTITSSRRLTPAAATTWRSTCGSAARRR